MDELEGFGEADDWDLLADNDDHHEDDEEFDLDSLDPDDEVWMSS